MSILTDVPLSLESLDRFVPILGEAAVAKTRDAAQKLSALMRNRIIWNVNSTASGGGVAEMLRPLIALARGAGVDTRWTVIHGSPEFFRITKRLHNALHGELGDGSVLDAEEHRIYDSMMRRNAQDLLAVARVGDVAILHDPQTAGLAPYLHRGGVHVLWRCHIGADSMNDQTALGWAFLEPYLRDVELSIFTRASYAPPMFDPTRVAIVQPSIDPLSPKNQPMDEARVHGILAHIGLVATNERDECANAVFSRQDGSPARVDRCADILRLGPPPSWETPLVVQVSRWDRLKDPVGVLQAFAAFNELGDATGAQLALVGPNVNGVADDPDGAAVFGEVTEAWRALPHNTRRMVNLVNLPTNDSDENGAMVNAIQRHAAVVTQKSLREGFGLTVTEAMWKARPVVASAVGGIRDQIEDGVSGLLIRDPTDGAEFAGALRRLLSNPELAHRIGEAAHERVRAQFLGLRHLVDYAHIIARIAATPVSAAA